MILNGLIRLGQISSATGNGAPEVDCNLRLPSQSN